MAAEFADYINALGLTDEAGNTLTLAESNEGIFQSGTYYDHIKATIETSLEHFLTDNEFPYTASSSSGFGGGRGGMGGRGGQMPEGDFGDFGGQKPDGDFEDFDVGDIDATEANYEQMDGITRGDTASSGLSLDGTYDTKQDYIDALNAEGEWVTWDEETGKVTITSVAAFTAALKSASKGIAAFDQLDGGQGENILFGYGDGNGAHFDAILAALVKGTDYEQAFADDLAREDGLGNTVDVRLNMYTPLYYLLPVYEGYQTSTVARYWRIRTGINQGDTALCTEVDLALALNSYNEDIQVDFETVWGLGHTTAERTGSSTENFIAWVNDCMQD